MILICRHFACSVSALYLFPVTQTLRNLPPIAKLSPATRKVTRVRRTTEVNGAALLNLFCRLSVTLSVLVTSGDSPGCAGKMEEVRLL